MIVFNNDVDAAVAKGLGISKNLTKDTEGLIREDLLGRIESSYAVQKKSSLRRWIDAHREQFSPELKQRVIKVLKGRSGCEQVLVRLMR
jgi:hypothetical protein